MRSLEAEQLFRTGHIYRQRRGWPLGFDVSQINSPLKPTSAAMSSAKLRIVISFSCPEVYGLRSVETLGRQHYGFRSTSST